MIIYAYKIGPSNAVLKSVTRRSCFRAHSDIHLKNFYKMCTINNYINFIVQNCKKFLADCYQDLVPKTYQD